MKNRLFATSSFGLVAAIVVCSVSSTALAAKKEGAVENIKITASGSVKVDGSWDSSEKYYVLCDLDSTWNGISPETCASWVTLMTAAQLSGKELSIDWGAGNTPVYDGEGTAVTPTHVKLR